MPWPSDSSKTAAGDERDPHRFEEARGHHPVVRGGQLAVRSGRPVGDLVVRVRERAVQRELVDRGDGDDAGQTTDTRLDRLVEAADFLDLAVVLARKRHPHREHALGEARIDLQHGLKAPQQQRGARQQHHHHRDLRHDDQPPRSAAVRSARSTSALRLQVFVGVHADRPPGRHQPEPQSRQQRPARSEQQDGQTHADLAGPRHRGGAHRDERRHGPVGQQHAESGAAEGEQAAFEQQLSRQQAGPRPERTADRHLLAAGGGPHEHQVREVGARDRQQERHRGHQHPERLAEAARQLLAIGHHQHAALARVAVGELLLQAPGDPVELGGDLPGARARAETDDHADEARRLAFVPPRILVGCERDRELDVAHGEGELRAHHAHHGEGFAVQGDRTPDQGRVAAESPLPEPVRQHHDLLVPRDVVRGAERPAERRGDAERVEEVGGDAQAGQPLRRALALAPQDAAPVGEAGDRFEAAALVAVVAELREREGEALARGVARVDPGEPLGRGERERLQQHGVHDAEQRRIGADPERQRDEREQREPGRVRQPSKRVTQVLDEVGHGASRELPRD